MTQKQLAEYLGKRSEYYLRKIEELAEASQDLKFKFQCYNGLLNYDFQVRASEYKEWLDKENLKLKKLAAKPSGKSVDVSEHDNEDDHYEDDDDATVLSLSLVKK